MKFFCRTYFLYYGIFLILTFDKKLRLSHCMCMYMRLGILSKTSILLKIKILWFFVAYLHTIEQGYNVDKVLRRCYGAEKVLRC